MLKYVLTLKVIFFIGIASSHDSIVQTEKVDSLAAFKAKLVDVWRVDSIGGEPIPASCLTSSIEYKSDGTIESYSGENKSLQKYEVLQKDGRWITRSKTISSNNKPNCQGYTMKHMDSNDVSDLVTNIVNGKMLWFSDTKEKAPFATLIRVVKSQ